MINYWWFILLLLLSITTMATAASHPMLYQTPADIQRARDNIAKYTWAKSAFKGIKTNADKWAVKNEDELRGIFPKKGSLFAYGFAGCPLCKSSWPTWGVGGVGDFSRPGKAMCPKCKHVFPDAKHPDDGNGWTDPETGKNYYFVGSYNAYVAQEVTLNALSELSTAYAITADEKYARAAAVLFDSLASLYPTTTIGSIDYPNAHLPGYIGGRLERPQYQVARVLVLLARYYDLLYNSKEFDKASVEAAMGSIRRNVEENILRNGGDFCWKIGTGLHMGLTNGQADYVRGVIAAGIMLGIDEYMDWALDGPTSVFTFLDNSLDRDGLYYETSTLYSEHAIHLYVDIGEMLINYRSAKYPEGINLYEHPKLQKAMVEALMEMNCAGHLARYGDSSPDMNVIEQPGWDQTGSYAYSFAERLYAYTRGSAKEFAWKMLQRLCNGDVKAYRDKMKSGSAVYWHLFHAEEPKGDTGSVEVYAPESRLLGGKGIAVLRSGEGANARALLLRYGPCLNHGNLDDLGTNIYALGREITYDLGYGLGSAHAYCGWSRQTAAHNLVVVNEKSQLKAGPTGGSPAYFTSLPGLQAVDANSPGSYQSEAVSIYRRSQIMVDFSPEKFYLVDLFRVSGGFSHDQFWHFTGTLDNVEGAALGPVEEKGSLAGPEIDWGTRIGPDGDIIGKDAGGPYWNAPPGNGYGFLHHLQRGKAESQVRLTWKINEKDSVKLTVMPQEAELVTGKAPGIYPRLPGVDCAVFRRKSSSSFFAAVIEPVREIGVVQEVERIGDSSGNRDAICIQINLANQRQDIVLQSEVRGNNPVSSRFICESKEVEVSAGLGFLSTNPFGLQRMTLIGGSLIRAGSVVLKTQQAGYTGTIGRIDFKTNRLYTAADLPDGKALVGQIIYLNNGEYSNTTPYTIRGIRKTGSYTEIDLGDASLLLARGLVGDNIDTEKGILQNRVPLEQATSVSRLETGVFTGKQIINKRTGEFTTVKRVGMRLNPDITVSNASVFKPGDPYVIYDLQPGDTFYIPTRVDLRLENNRYRLVSNMPVELEIGDKKEAFGVGEKVLNTPVIQF